MKATLRFSEKFVLKNRYIVETTLHEVNDPKRYPKGVKYGLICIDTKTGKKILMDNHHPKNDHIHINETEISYEFKTVEKLIEDFKRLVFEHLGVSI
jgi:hypothetical protein